MISFVIFSLDCTLHTIEVVESHVNFNGIYCT